METNYQISSQSPSPNLFLNIPSSSSTPFEINSNGGVNFMYDDDDDYAEFISNIVMNENDSVRKSKDAIVR